MEIPYTSLVMAGVLLGFYVWIFTWGLTLVWRVIVRWLGW